ncbi:MAG: hypothetical protein ACXWW0_03960 [Bacteroidia bacterium]
MKKVTIALFCLFSIGFLFSVLQSCEKESYRGSYDHSFLKLDLIQGEQHRIIGIKKDSSSIANLQYFILDPTLPNNGIRYDSIALNVTNFFEEIKRIAGFRFSLFSPALATEPVPPRFSYDKLDSVIVTSSEDYNDTLPKESNLAVIMSVHHNLSKWGNNFAAYIPYGEMFYEYLTYTFKGEPSETKLHNLTFRYVLRDGREVSTTVNNVLIKK